MNTGLSIEAVNTWVDEGDDAEFLISGPSELEGEYVKLKYLYKGYDEYFASSTPAGTYWVQLTNAISLSDRSVEGHGCDCP